MTTIAEAVAATRIRHVPGVEPLIIEFDSKAKPINRPLSTCGSVAINGTTSYYITGGGFDTADITLYAGRSQANVKTVYWLPFDCDIVTFVDVPRETVYTWPQQMIDDVVIEMEREIRRVFDLMELPIHRLDYTGHGLCAYIYLPPHDINQVPEIADIYGLLVDRVNDVAGGTLADTSVRDAGSRITRLVPSPNMKSDPPRITETRLLVPFNDIPVTLQHLRSVSGERESRTTRPLVIGTEILPADIVEKIINALKPHWQSSQRHLMALGISGMLAKAGVPEVQAIEIIQIVAEEDEEILDRVRAVEDTYRKAAAGRDVRGYTAMNAAIDPKVLAYVDGLLEDARKATAPRITIGKRTYENVTVDDEVHEFKYTPVPESALRGWIAEYVALVSPTTEAAVAFHLAAALVLIATTIGRRIMIRGGAGPLFANIFMLLVGRSGWSRKDTAIRIATNLLRKEFTVGSRVIRPETSVITNVSSYEGLLKVMSDLNGNVLLELTEFSELMANAERKGTSTITTALMRAYDMPPRLENLSKANPITVENPILSVLAATQPSTLADTMRSLHITSGFANRFMFVPGDSLGPKPIAEDLDERALTALYLRLRDTVHAYPAGTMLSLDAESREFWWDWYTNSFWGATGSPEEDSMRVRHQDLIFKLALMHAVIDQSSVIRMEHLRVAFTIYEWSWGHLQQIMGGWGQQMANEIEQRFIAILKERGAVKKHDLFRSSRNRKWTTSDMHRVFDSMVKADMIEVDLETVVAIRVH
jgi:hypothetical protein